jgi:hypothetical protein
MHQRMSGRLVAFGVFAIIAGAVACSSDSAGPSLSGSWHGFVVMHNEFGVPLTSDSGVVVTLSNNGHAGPSTVSSANGSYTFSSVHTGAYTLAYSGDAMGTFLRPEVAFVGGGTQFLGIEDFSTASTGTVTSLAASGVAGHDTLRVTGSIAAPPAGLSRLVRLFFGSDTTVSAAPSAYMVSTSFKTTNGILSVVITDTTLANLRSAFGEGSPAFVVGYGDSFFTNSYVDTATGNTVYPNVSATPSNVVAFIVP